LRGIRPLRGLIEVFDGNTGDPATLAAQIAKLKQRFGLDRVVLAGDRGMITEARLTEDVKTAGFDWITALRAPAIKDLVKGGALQLSLFDERDMASITSPDFPGERLIVCRASGDPQADHRPDAGWPTGAQLPHTARRSRDTDTQYHRRRDHTRSAVVPDDPPNPRPTRAFELLDLAL
jgi:hypothetical protein